MNIELDKYSKYALCREMYDTVEVIAQMSNGTTFEKPSRKEKIFITGEGSSRIFPAKNMLYENLKNGGALAIFTEGATQALEYDLSEMFVLGISNSGRTKELIRLFNNLKDSQHPKRYGITANDATLLKEVSHGTHILGCGKEEAVAATKSVVEQALLVEQLMGIRKIDYKKLASSFQSVLDTQISNDIIDKLAKADTLYFSGKNNGVAEELTIKTNEIPRKKSDYLEGTYAVHGIEEVMTKNDALVLIEPFTDEQEQYYKIFKQELGLQVVAIASQPTIFETILIPDIKEYASYLTLAAGWNLLVELGLALDINLDKPERARKIGNEFKSTL